MKSRQTAAREPVGKTSRFLLGIVREEVDGATDPVGTPVQNVGVHLSCPDIVVT